MYTKKVHLEKGVIYASIKKDKILLAKRDFFKNCDEPMWMIWSSDAKKYDYLFKVANEWADSIIEVDKRNTEKEI